MTSVSASGVCAWQAFRMQECAIVFGIAQLSGKLGEKRKRGKASVKESWKPGGSGRVYFLLVSPGVCSRREGTHMD